MNHNNKKWVEITKTILLAVLTYLIVINTVSITKVSGHSMIPTLKDNSFIFVNKAIYKFKKPQIGDIVVIKHNNYYLVKRIVALDNDSIEIKDGFVLVNDTPLIEIYPVGKPENMNKIVVPKNHVFLLGDNREAGESFDSRNPKLGPVEMSSIIGKVEFSIFPFYKIMYPLSKVSSR